MHRFAVSLVLMLGIAGCAEQREAPPAAAAAPPPAATRTVLDPQLKALEKARAVQDTVDQQKASTDAQLQQAEGG